MAYVADLAELSPVFAGALHHCLATDGSLGECGAPYALLRHDTAAVRKGNVLVPIRELCARVQSVCAVRFQPLVVLSYPRVERRNHERIDELLRESQVRRPVVVVQASAHPHLLAAEALHHRTIDQVSIAYTHQ